MEVLDGMKGFDGMKIYGGMEVFSGMKYLAGYYSWLGIDKIIDKKVPVMQDF